MGQVKIEVFTDGSCIDNGSKDAQAGCGLWYGQNDPRNQAIKLPPSVEQSNNSGEAVAVLVAAQTAPKNAELHIYSDSTFVIDGLTENLKDCENQGWIGRSNKEILKATAAHLRQRKGRTIFHKVKGHSGNEGNDGADALAGVGAQKEEPDNIDLTIPGNLTTTGAHLASMTQSILYRGIKEKIKVPIRRDALISLDMIRCAVKDAVGTSPTDERIWKSFRHTDVSKSISAFMWKTAQNAYKIGDYWMNIPTMEIRA
ncbi:ribonuclease H-like domain-containing protein, partial [Collybia nuda]